MTNSLRRTTKSNTYLTKVISKILVSSILISMIFSLSGCFLIPKEEEVLAPILKEPPKVVYTTVEMKKSTFEKKAELSGTFISVSKKDLSFLNASGRLKAINVKLGDTVKKGDLLAELISGDLVDQIKEQELLQKKSQLSLETIKINAVTDNKILEKQLNSLRTELENMQFTAESYSKKEINDLKEQVEEKDITYKNSLALYKNSIKVAENDLALCQLKLDTLRKKLDDTRIISPTDGVVSFITDVQEGNNIDAYATVVSISDPKCLQISSTVEPVNPFQLGMKVSVKVNDFETEGEVVMSPANMPSDASDSIKNTIRVKCAKLPSEVKLGDYANITLYQIKKENVIVIDKNLIRIANDRKFVNVLEKGLKKERYIEVGDENNTQSIVVKGLSEGDLVIK